MIAIGLAIFDPDVAKSREKFFDHFAQFALGEVDAEAIVCAGAESGLDVAHQQANEKGKYNNSGLLYDTLRPPPPLGALSARD